MTVVCELDGTIASDVAVGVDVDDSNFGCAGEPNHHEDAGDGVVLLDVDDDCDTVDVV